MKIQITENCKNGVSVKVDGVELSNYVSEFHLTQKAHECPELVLKMPILNELEIDLPDGVVIVDKTADQD